MKAVPVCVVFAAVCVTLAAAEQSVIILTLNRVMYNLKIIQGGLAKNSSSLHSPTISDMKTCCEAAALECFRSQFFHLTVSDKHKKYQTIVLRELGKLITRSGVSTCKPEETQKQKCKSCESYQKTDGQTFVHNLHTLLQKIYTSQP